MYKILIVDSSTSILTAFTAYLSINEYSVFSSPTASNALVKIPRIKPDLIAVSSRLDDMSGFDFCKIIKASPEYRDILILMLLEDDSTSQVRKAVYAGCNDYILRSASGKLLISKLQSLFRINDLNNSLKSRYDELERTNKYFQLQIQMAMKVQRSVIKDMEISFKDIRAITKYLPAMAIGGDFFNVRILDKNRLGIIIGDVSGHGISSSLLTVMLSQVFVSVCHDIEQPGTLLKRMNEAFYSIFEGSDSDMYACVFYAIVDTSKKTVLYSNAGETYPIRIAKQGGEVRELVSDGIPVGMLKDTTYKNKSFEYKSGDYMFFYTDGLGDIHYKEDNSLFAEKLKDMLSVGIKSGVKMETVLDTILTEFYDSSDSQKYKNDDVSAILCKL